MQPEVMTDSREKPAPGSSGSKAAGQQESISQLIERYAPSQQHDERVRKQLADAKRGAKASQTSQEHAMTEEEQAHYRLLVKCGQGVKIPCVAHGSCR